MNDLLDLTQNIPSESHLKKYLEGSRINIVKVLNFVGEIFLDGVSMISQRWGGLGGMSLFPSFSI